MRADRIYGSVQPGKVRIDSVFIDCADNDCIRYTIHLSDAVHLMLLFDIRGHPNTVSSLHSSITSSQCIPPFRLLSCSFTSLVVTSAESSSLCQTSSNNVSTLEKLARPTNSALHLSLCFTKDLHPSTTWACLLMLARRFVTLV